MANEVDYSPCKYTGNGLTTDFSFSWKVMDIQELIVELENISTGDISVLVLGTDYTANLNAVGGSVSLTTAPTSAYYIHLKRKTSNYQSKGFSTSTGFQGSEIEKSFDKFSCCLQDMDYNIEKFKTDFSEEVGNDITTISNSVDTANATASMALLTANNANAKSDTAISTANTASSNASTAVSTANSANTKADNAVSTANTASTNASNAVSTANTASTNASSAVSTASTANTNASNAVTTANSALSKANTAISTANTASTNASNAVSTANSASSTANTALSTANTASTNASNAVSTANNASSTATAASNKVDSFETDIAAVISAADKINELTEAVTTATTAAGTATQKAQLASDKADIATQKAQEATQAASTFKQSDWNETDTTDSGYIKNKPTIPDAQIQSDWTQSDTDAKDYIKNKPTIPTVPTDVSAFNNDAGYLTSHQDISGKEDIAKAINVLETSGTIALTDNSLNSITPTGNVTFTLPTVTDNTKFHQILVQINISTAYTFDVGTTYFFNSTAPDLSATGVYNLIFEYDKANQYWVCGLLSKGSAS